MSTSHAGVSIPGLFPEPKELNETGGDTDLSQDVRLVTSNVLPLQRKAMRGILTEAGVRVVANKKKYVIEAKVEEESDFDFTGVPEQARGEYYELELRGSLVFIRTPTQEGALWATQTLGAIYKAFAQGFVPPNLTIRDWPVMPDRGIFVESKWGPDRMLATDWCEVIDRVSALKMNRLGVGLYGCWGNCRFEGTLTEFLQVPVPDHDELKKEHHLEWYSPRNDEWKEDTYLSPMFESDFFADVVDYGREKGVTVIPFVNSLGHNTLIPRLYPAVSAKDEDGTARGVGYSIADPVTREFISTFYGSIIERYFPNGIDYFHIELDEVWPDYPDPDDPHRVESPWCDAPVSQKQSQEENLRDYIFWLVKMLTDKGVGKVVIWNDQLTRHMDVLDEDFVKQLEDAGLKDRLIVHWWWYSNDALNDQTRVQIGKDMGLEGWVAPMTCYFNWSRYDYRRQNIEMMLEMGHQDGACGALSYAVHDPSHSDHEALLAAYAWTGMDAGSHDEVQKRWAEVFGDKSDVYLDAADALVKASTEYPALAPCHHYTYTYCNKDLPWPRPYPGEALERLAGMDGNPAEQLREAADLARKAVETFGQLVDDEEIKGTPEAAAKSLQADAARIDALATAFAFFCDLKNSKADDPAAQCDAARERLVNAMAIVETGKPDWVMPACLQSLSVLLRFLEQLKEDIDAGGDIRWTV